MKGCYNCISRRFDKYVKSMRTYHKEVMRTRTLIRVNLQREGEEVSEDWRQGVLFLDCRCAVRRNKPKGAKRALIQVWRFSFDHLDRHDTQ